MKYVIRINRPLIDNEVAELEVEDRATAALAIAQLMMMEDVMSDGTFQVLKHEESDDGMELKVTTTTGYFHAIPAHRAKN